MADDQTDKTQVSRPTTEDYVSLPPGALVGRFEIVSVLGQGGFGITYRARDTQLDRDVAIKEYLPSSLAIRHEGNTVLPRSTQVADDFVWGRARFLDEAKVMARLGNAPAIVRVHEFLETNGTAYVVMPLLEGETLEARLKRETRMHQPAIERILYPLLDGLEQVHAAGFLHRDIKPANIILDATGAPTLIDFGASRAAMQGRTQAMTAVFTPGFAPLEQFVSGKQGPWTDIYALAATLYTCINGKPPPNAMERMIGEPIVPATEIGRRKYAPSLLAAIDAGLRVKAESRPQTIEEWREVLTMGRLARADDALADGNATDVSAPRPPPLATPAVTRAEMPAVSAPSPAQTKSRVPLLAGIAAVVLLAAGGGYFALSPSSKPTASGTALQDLKVEDLERVLAERRKADAAAAEKKRLEEEAQRKAEADAASKRAADAELADAQLKRQRAEEELAKLKADMEARRQAESGQQVQADAANKRAAEEAAQRKAEAEMAALRRTEVDAQKKAAAEAETQKKADEALARAQAERAAAEAEARQKADAETKRRSEADARQSAEAQAREQEQAAADAKAKADTEREKKAAEAAESGLKLTILDRQHAQVALTALGFDTHGSDGSFGPRSREAITAWQKTRNEPSTGFLTGAQNQALLTTAAAAVAKFDTDQKKIEEDKRKAEEEVKKKAGEDAKPKAAIASPTTPTPVARGPNGDGLWRGSYRCTASASGGSSFDLAFQVTVSGGNGTWKRSGSGTPGNPTMTVKIRGNAVTVYREFLPFNQGVVFKTGSMTARYDGANSIAGSGPEDNGRTCAIDLTRE